MLYAFSVKNYKNIRELKKISLTNKETVIYGICGSGKTNLCKAIADILGKRPISNLDNSDTTDFKYEFILDGKRVICEYSRNCEGKIICQHIQIPEDRFLCQNTQSEYEYKDFLQTIVDKHELISQLLRYLSDIWIISEDNLNRYKDSMLTRRTATLVICDGAEWLYNLISMKQYQQIIFTTRRISWIRELTNHPQACYSIKDGTVCAVNELTEKNMDTVSKVCNFLKYLP